uniref:Uncharacterized protein n=1 Tax=Lepeophtheirus salmonis TaxID=72036 RepID=A0A0K2UCA6_LEPSM
MQQNFVLKLGTFYLGLSQGGSVCSPGLSQVKLMLWKKKYYMELVWHPTLESHRVKLVILFSSRKVFWDVGGYYLAQQFIQVFRLERKGARR